MSLPTHLLPYQGPESWVDTEWAGQWLGLEPSSDRKEKHKLLCNFQKTQSLQAGSSTSDPSILPTRLPCGPKAEGPFPKRRNQIKSPAFPINTQQAKI